MAKRSTGDILEAISIALNSLSGVFSTVQWGGRAYKVPNKSGSKKKPKLLAHVCANQDSGNITASFKLPSDRADSVIDEHDWIEPHSFRTLAPSGWLIATVKTKRQCNTLIKLLKESHLQLAPKESTSVHGTTKREVSDPVVSRMNQVMQRKKSEGWTPQDDFDDK